MTTMRSDPRKRLLTAMVVLTVLLGPAACAANDPDAVGSATQESDREPADEAGEEEGDETMDEVPAELLDEMTDHLAEKTGAERDDIEVVRAEAVTWGDASLGCPEPGKMYAQMLTDGYWVILRHAGEDYDYRASRSSFTLCEQKKRREPVGR